MLDLINGIAKAAAGVAVDVPLSIAADVVTMGGAVTDKDRPYTTEAVARVFDNVQSTIKPSQNR